MELNSLPEQLTFYIFDFLVDKDICNIIAVNQKFKSLVAEEDYLWKSLYIRKFGKAAESEQDETDKSNLGWKAAYILRKKLEHCKRKVFFVSFCPYPHPPPSSSPLINMLYLVELYCVLTIASAVFKNRH